MELAEAFLREVETVGDAWTVVAGRCGDGPGVRAPALPRRGPARRRAAPATAGFYPGSPAVVLAEAVLDRTGERPTLDLALATVARALGLPPGGAMALFAVGRTVGWIGHAIEQYAGDVRVRPRAAMR